MKTTVQSPLHGSIAHESARRHVTGEARYIDDIPKPPGMLWAYPVVSEQAHAEILNIDIEAAKAVKGIEAILLAKDVPGENQIGALISDEPLLAEGKVYAVGQVIALILGQSLKACREAKALITITYKPLPALLDIREAVARASFQSPPHIIQRGSIEEALKQSAWVIEGEVLTPDQEHFYLETQAALCIPLEGNNYHIYASSQNPSEIQAKIAEILNIKRHQIVVEMPRMGGGFGGKETQGAPIAALAALGSWYTQKPVECWLSRDQDMIQTGKRHPFYSLYRAGFDQRGQILALDVKIYADGGWSNDLSRAILDRALFHLDNAYYIPTVRFEGRVVRTHKVSNTAFRGFGGPQGIMVIETIMNKAAAHFGLDPVEIRAKNYYGNYPRNRTPYEQEVIEPRLQRIHEELLSSSQYIARRRAIEAFNQKSKWVKRGLGFQPVKFGISFTVSFLNQAGAYLLIYGDGTVQLSHGGTEMGQGLHTKMLAICAHELGIPITEIRMMNTSTDKVPNTSATAASTGADLNGQAVRSAAATLRERLRPVAAQLLEVVEEDRHYLIFENGRVWNSARTRSVSFKEVVQQAYLQQISLSATGFYRTPNIQYDPSQGRGKPFHYYAYGAAITEVEVHRWTGEYRILRADILHDVGDSLLKNIDRGQVEGAYIQGVGWLTTEELVWSKDGHLLTASPGTYKIPAIGDIPMDFRVSLLKDARQSNVIHGSKAVGEPPFVLGLSALTALADAVKAWTGTWPDLKLPATSESVLRAIETGLGAKS